MSFLTTRAEQGLLGAILRDGPQQQVDGGDLADSLALLEADDFGHRAHQQVWTALVELRAADPGLNGDRLLDVVATRLDAPGADRAWLERLRDSGAHRRHLPSYIRMIQTAALRREIAATAERLTVQGGNPRLAEALARQVAAHESITADALDPKLLPPGEGVAPEPSSLQPQLSLPEVQPAAIEYDRQAMATRADREDLLLADLLRNPEQAAELARVFPAESLTDPQRREVFRTIVAIAAEGDPVDGVIVAVDIERQRAYAAYITDPIERVFSEPPIEPADPGSEPAPAYLNRLTQLGIRTGSDVIAVEIARDLISEDIRTHLANHAPPPPARSQSGPHPVREALSPSPESPSQAMPLPPPQHRPGPPQAPGSTPRIQP